MQKFKRTSGLPRVQRVLGILRGFHPASLLDVGSGRGAFLWPVLDAFPGLRVVAIDHSPRRVEDIAAVHRGSVVTLSALRADAHWIPLASASQDVVTLLEVLEHLHSPSAAVAEAIRVAGRAVVLSVPSRADNNPEHIHLFDGKQIEALFLEGGATKVRCEFVLNHLIAVATVRR